MPAFLATPIVERARAMPQWHRRHRGRTITQSGDTKVKKFLVLYCAPRSAHEQMANATPEQAKAGMDAWMAWAGRAAHAIVDMGAPVQQVAHLNGGASAGHIGGYGIVQADSTEAATRLFEGHPHLGMPGASIEIHELLSMPGT